MFLRTFEDGVQPQVAARPCERALHHPADGGRNELSIAPASNRLDGNAELLAGFSRRRIEMARAIYKQILRNWSPRPHERWRICWAILRHMSVDNPISSSITPRRGIRTSRFPRRRQIPCNGCCTGE